MTTDLEDIHISPSDSDLDAPDEPGPIWEDAPRLCPQLELPAYRHIPGSNPHPFHEPEGHSYKKKNDTPVPFHEDNWMQCEPYVFGIDLYHQGYFWEAQYAWEGLYKAAKKDSLEANFLQALILNSSAMIKMYQQNSKSLQLKSQGARWRLARLRTAGHDGPDSRLFGLDIADLIEQIKRYYSPAWWNEDTTFVQLTSDPPRLETKI